VSSLPSSSSSQQAPSTHQQSISSQSCNGTGNYSPHPTSPPLPPLRPFLLVVLCYSTAMVLVRRRQRQPKKKDSNSLYCHIIPCHLLFPGGGVKLLLRLG
jgi:hypothetical protein